MEAKNEKEAKLEEGVVALTMTHVSSIDKVKNMFCNSWFSTSWTNSATPLTFRGSAVRVSKLFYI